MKYGMCTIEYADGFVVPSAVMGKGSILVQSTTLNGDGLVGVRLSDLPTDEERAIGVLPTTPAHSTYPSGIGFEMLFDNPASIDVVISQLEEAKATLLEADVEKPL